MAGDEVGAVRLRVRDLQGDGAMVDGRRAGWREPCLGLLLLLGWDKPGTEEMGDWRALRRSDTGSGQARVSSVVFRGFGRQWVGMVQEESPSCRDIPTYEPRKRRI